MQPNLRKRSIRHSFNVTAICFLALALCLVGLPLAAEQGQQPPPPPPDQQQAAQQQADQQQPGSDAGQAANQDAGPPAPAVPPTITLPAGTVITVRTNDWLSSERNKAGDTFTASLERPLIAGGWVVARRGQNVIGKISLAQKAGHLGGGVSKLGIELGEVTIVDGQVLPVKSQLLSTSAGSSSGRDAATIVGTTGMGAAIGGAAGGGAGAGIGAAAGAFAGVFGVLLTGGRPTIVPPESLLTFRLAEPMTVSTTQSQFAFQPVGPDDYPAQTSSGPRQRRLVYGPGYPYGPYGYGPYGYPYGGWYGYPGPLYFGFYGGPYYYHYRGHP